MLNQKMSLDSMAKMVKLSEEMVKPQLKKALGLTGPPLREHLIQLMMALGYGIAVLANQFWYATDPDEFGRNVGIYISSTMKSLRDRDKKEKDNESSSTKAESAWDERLN